MPVPQGYDDTLSWTRPELRIGCDREELTERIGVLQQDIATETYLP